MHPRPKRSLGQNFLRDEKVVARIIDSLDLNSQDTVIEVGPGLGALTGHLVGHGTNVIAIEFDRDMVAELRSTFPDTANLTIVNTDALSVDFEDLLGNTSRVKVVANLPYNISTAILQRFIAKRELFTVLVLMFQKEVVDRILALPGKSERGFLTVLTQNAFTAERLFDVPPDAFFPVPKVQSSVVKLMPCTNTFDLEALERVASAAFRQKRKTLHNNLKETEFSFVLTAAGVDPGRRAETLTNEEWKTVVEALNNK